MTTILETQSVTKTYKIDNNVINAVDDVSIQINSGEFIALVGPSGSGKTTMLAMLAGLLTPTTGKVIIEGQVLSQMSEKQRTQFRGQRIGFTFQANNLVPYLTALENVELMLRLNKSFNKNTKHYAKDLLTKLGLGNRLDNLPSQLSGGQQQRVAIARSLVHTPGIVLADEPTASLDTERAYQVVDIFANLIRSQNAAGIMVTHDLRMCQNVDKIIQMRDGKVAKVLSHKKDIQAFANPNFLANPNNNTNTINDTNGSIIPTAPKILSSHLNHHKAIPLAKYANPAI